MPTLGEALDLWANDMERRGYRALAFLDIDFRPQYTIGSYRADAFLPKYKVVVEFDDISHNSVKHRSSDEVRDMYMAMLGYYTLRIPYRTMKRNTIMAVKEALESIGIPSNVHFGACALSPDEIVTIEARQHMYLAGYVNSAGLLVPVFRHREW